jgi:trimeric autotransporter adhesin
MIGVRVVRPARNKALALGFLLAVVAVMLLTGRSAHAATTFTVNQTGNLGDAVRNGMCDVLLTTAGNQCTLRAAIQEANATPGKDTINFNIPGGGVKTIKPSSALPKIRDEVIIDGYSQPGASANTLAAGTNAVLKIELNGEGRPFPGLWLITSDSVVKGLVINRFDHIGIEIGPSGSGNKIAGNFIGTNAAGTLDRGNLGRGVTIFGEDTSSNTVGSGRPASRNLISGNDSGGVGLFGPDNAILGNLIGTKKDGASPLGNSGNGVDIRIPEFYDMDEANNVVGGTLPGDANAIAFNNGDGVNLWASDINTGNSILRNSIFANIDLFPDGLGIDLGDDGPTPNDEDDADDGPNNLQNKPTLTSAENAGGETTVRGSLNSRPNQKFKVRFFSSSPGGSEGEKYIGVKQVTTGANGNTGAFSFRPENKVPLGQNITATATRNSTGDTSEFAGPEEVV